MASTNKTTNYDLPQWIGTDKPTWQGDLNNAFSTIDEAMNTNKTKSELAESKVNNLEPQVELNKNNIGDMDNLDTTAKDSLVKAINEVNTKQTADKVGDLSDLNTTNKTDAVSAINEVLSIANNANNNTNINKNNIGNMNELDTKTKDNLVDAINELNNSTIITISQLTPSNFTYSEGSLVQGTIYMAKNSDETMFKIYGYILWNSSATVGARSYSITIPSSQNILTYRPTSRREFYCIGSTTSNETFECSIFLEPNGNITIEGSISVDKSMHCASILINTPLYIKTN